MLIFILNASQRLFIILLNMKTMSNFFVSKHASASILISGCGAHNFLIMLWLFLIFLYVLVSALIMFKTSRFWPLVLSDDDDANTIKVAYGHTRITHITGVWVYQFIEGCSALPALGLLGRCKLETQGQLSRCGWVIRQRLGLLHLGLAGQKSKKKPPHLWPTVRGIYRADTWVVDAVHGCTNDVAKCRWHKRAKHSV